MDMSIDIDCTDPEVRREVWVGNGDLKVVCVDTGIEAMGTGGTSWEGTRLEKSQGPRAGPGEGGLGGEEPEEGWIGKPRFFAWHPVPTFLAQILTFPHCPAHWPPSS